ncbi:MAG: N-acyl-D-amino-acid deacylase family protein [Pseudomonadales bacterium]
MNETPDFDIIIKGALVFDGSGGPAVREDVAVVDGKITARGQNLHAGSNTQVIDASGQWLMPGLLDIHTHLDLEVEIDPALGEAVRHGTTTAIVGNCSLGVAFGAQAQQDQNPVVDCFARVENIPKHVLQKCADALTWDTPAGYLQHFDDIALGPNIAPLIPHSMLRIEVMGLQDSISRDPSEAEIEKMNQLLHDALQQGYIGFSTDALPFHYLANDPNKASRIPTQFVTDEELRSLTDIVRDLDRVWQATPDPENRLRMLKRFFLTSGRFYGKPLRLSALAAMDFIADRRASAAFGFLGRLLNSRLVQGKFHFQALSAPFKMWGDGVTTPLLEEIPSTARLIACELEDRQGRLALLNDPKFIKEFKHDWFKSKSGFNFSRNLNEMFVEWCPVADWMGHSLGEIYQRLLTFQKNFGSVKDSVEIEFFRTCPDPIGDEADFLMHLLREFDKDLRWWMIVANDRPEKIKEALFNPNNLPGFNDSGAHLTNLAFFDGNLLTLQIAQQESIELVARAVQRLTSEPAEFFGLDVGTLNIGAQADIVLIDPEQLARYDSDAHRIMIYREIFENEQLVNRSDGVVSGVFIAGERVWTGNYFGPALGSRKLGRVLTYAGRDS